MHVTSLSGALNSEDENTKVKGNAESVPVIPTENPVAKNPRDAREEKEKMKQNRKKLGVEEDHQGYGKAQPRDLSLKARWIKVQNSMPETIGVKVKAGSRRHP